MSQVSTKKQYSAMTPGELIGGVVALFQPIYGVREGRVVGFEALARLRSGGRLLTPTQFLPTLHVDQSFSLFHAMLVEAITFLQELEQEALHLYVSVNVDASLLQHRDFQELVRFTLALHQGRPHQLLLELLEGEAITDIAAMAQAIDGLKQLGLMVALDDVGSAYASLIHIKDLPVDVMKLDQAFSRRLAERPEDLQFVSSMLALARSLDRKLVVEGVETADILNALTILGVEYVQGYGVGRPMTGQDCRGWLKTKTFPPRSREPTSMIGVYAAHLTIVEACRVLAAQSLKLRWHEDAADPHRCKIGKFLDRHGLHDTPFGEAHRRFHRSLADIDQTSQAWRGAAEDLRVRLLEELRRHGAADRNSAAGGLNQPTDFVLSPRRS